MVFHCFYMVFPLIFVGFSMFFHGFSTVLARFRTARGDPGAQRLLLLLLPEAVAVALEELRGHHLVPRHRILHEKHGVLMHFPSKTGMKRALSEANLGEIRDLWVVQQVLGSKSLSRQSR